MREQSEKEKKYIKKTKNIGEKKEVEESVLRGQSTGQQHDTTKDAVEVNEEADSTAADVGENAIVKEVVPVKHSKAKNTEVENPQVGIKERRPRKQVKRKRIIYDTDTSDEGHLVPSKLRKTDKGGYAHSKLSRSRISKANTGNTPWNKGQQRSEADKAKIAASVKARNTLILREQLKNSNMTEMEFHSIRREIKLMRERIRRVKMTRNKQKEVTLTEAFNKALSKRDEILNVEVGEITKSDIDAVIKADEVKRMAASQNATAQVKESFKEAQEKETEVLPEIPMSVDSATSASNNRSDVIARRSARFHHAVYDTVV